MKVILFFVVLAQAALMTAAAFVIASHVGRIEGWLSHQGYPYRVLTWVEVTDGPDKGRRGLVMIAPSIGVVLSDANGRADGPIRAFNSNELTPMPSFTLQQGGATLDTSPAVGESK